MRRNAAAGYLPQRLNILDDGLSVVDNVRAVAPRASAGDVRAGLARFLLRGGRADQPAAASRTPARRPGLARGRRADARAVVVAASR